MQEFSPLNHNANDHNLEIAHFGVCRHCGGTKLVDAPAFIGTTENNIPNLNIEQRLSELERRIKALELPNIIFK